MPIPKFVYFDLGNVLCFFDHDQSSAQMADLAGTTPETIRQIVYESDLEHRYETGLLTSNQFVEEIADKLGKKLPVSEMLDAASNMFRENKAIIPVLDEIRSQGIPIGLLSNTCQAHWDWIKRQRYQSVMNWFDPIVLSFEVNLMKPDPRIYRVSTEKAGVDAQSIFFTDDRLDNIESAANFGWKTHPFVSAQELMNLVKSWKHQT